MNDNTDLLMLRGVAALCRDCAGERVFVPVDRDCYCCTSCDAAVLLLEVVAAAGHPESRVA